MDARAFASIFPPHSGVAEGIICHIKQSKSERHSDVPRSFFTFNFMPAFTNSNVDPFDQLSYNYNIGEK